MSKYDSDCRRQMDGLNSPRLEGHTTPLKNHIERAESDGREEIISESRWIPDTGSLLERTSEGSSRKKDDAPKTPDAEWMEWMDGAPTSRLTESNTDGEWMEWMDGAQTPGLAESYTARKNQLRAKSRLGRRDLGQGLVKCSALRKVVTFAGNMDDAPTRAGISPPTKKSLPTWSTS